MQDTHDTQDTRGSLTSRADGRSLEVAGNIDPIGRYHEVPASSEGCEWTKGQHVAQKAFAVNQNVNVLSERH